jgi:hypothetical protein
MPTKDGSTPRKETTMIEDKARVLLVLAQDVLDRARVCAGQATATLKLPVSLQIVLRALIEEGLKSPDSRAFLANVEDQAKAVRHIRRAAREGGRGEGMHGDERSRVQSQASIRERQRPRK